MIKQYIKSLFEREKVSEKYNTRHDGKLTSFDTKQIIEQIHREFFAASEKIVEDAKGIINNLPETNSSKAERLRVMGFHQTQEVVKDSEKKQAEQAAQKAMETALYFTHHYPLYRYIDDAAIDRICKKYNLVFGENIRYKGFIPEKNLKEIEAFKIKEEDCFYAHSWTSYITYEKMLSENSYEEFKEQHKPREHGFSLAYLGNRIERIETLFICAPLKDMDVTKAKLEGNRIIEYPDPIVLRRVRGGGYLIITAWGDEASDPEVVNSKMN